MKYVTCQAGNAQSSGTPGSTSFTRGSLLYLMFTGYVYFYMVSVVGFMITIVDFGFECWYIYYNS